MLDAAAQSRAKRIASAPRVGNPLAIAAVQEVFAAGLPVVLEAYFFRCGCSSDYYLVDDYAAFDSTCGRFRGDNPEFYLYKVESLIDAGPTVSWLLHGRDADLKQAFGESGILLIRCSREGEDERYLLMNTQDKFESFLSQEWAGWEIVACDVFEATERVESVMVMPQPG